jgi:hypothetical protein
VDGAVDPGGLVVSGGGSVVVATDELRAQSDALHALVGTLTEVHREVTAISQRHSNAWLVTVDAPISAQAADRAAVASTALIRRCVGEALRVVWMLRTAMHNYGVVEAVNEQMARALSARAGYLVGRLTPLLVLLALPLLDEAMVATLLTSLATDRTPAEVLRDLGAWAREQNEVLNDPATVALVRGAMHSSDDVVGGLLQARPDLVMILGEEGLGLLGLSSTATLAVLLARAAGTMKETGVVVARATTTATTAPRTLVGRAHRIPEPAPGAPAQVRIDRYRTPGKPDRFEVYIAGTQDQGLGPGDEPWDMSSNVAGIAGLPAASITAVREAMTQAGITAESPVVLTGYSQGALAAATIAASGAYNVSNVVTFGAPTGLIEIPASVSVLNVRHTDDIVPALGGFDETRHALLIEREVFAGVPVPSEELFPAHRLSGYRETAALIDNAESAVVRDALADLRTFAGVDASATTTVESSTYLARRVPPDED